MRNNKTLFDAYKELIETAGTADPREQSALLLSALNVRREINEHEERKERKKAVRIYLSKKEELIELDIRLANKLVLLRPAFLGNASKLAGWGALVILIIVAFLGQHFVFGQGIPTFGDTVPECSPEIVREMVSSYTIAYCTIFGVYWAIVLIIAVLIIIFGVKSR